MDFTDKIVLITGGSRGIGRATAIAFSRLGAKIVLNFRKDSDAAADTIRNLDGEGHIAIKADISHPAAVRKMFEAIMAEYGHIDIVVNNAGVYVEHAIDHANYSEWQKAWEKTLAVNLTGPANVSYCAAQYMMANQSGRIVNISSRGAFRGEPTHPGYAASKAGLNAMSQSLAQALAPHGIFVGVVAPGFVSTDMANDILESEKGEGIKAQSPLNRVATPEEVAHCVLFLASDEAAFTTGAILDINGASYLRS